VGVAGKFQSTALPLASQFSQHERLGSMVWVMDGSHGACSPMMVVRCLIEVHRPLTAAGSCQIP
jgi:hypothetical protein